MKIIFWVIFHKEFFIHDPRGFFFILWFTQMNPTLWIILSPATVSTQFAQSEWLQDLIAKLLIKMQTISRSICKRTVDYQNPIRQKRAKLGLEGRRGKK